MHTKILIRPLNFHLRYQHWESQQKQIDFSDLHQCYTSHVFEHKNNNIKFEATKLYAKLYWDVNFNDLEQLAYIIEHFKNTLLKNKYSILKSEERNEVWDKGIKVKVLGIILKADTFYDELGEQTEINYGDIYLEQHIFEEKQSLIITAKYYLERVNYSFEKLMELLLKG